MAVQTRGRLVAALLAGGLLLAACGGGSTAQPQAAAPAQKAAAPQAAPAAQPASGGSLKTIRVAVFPATAQNWLFYVGQTQGFFKQAGLDVQITAIPSTPNTMQAVATGAIDIANNGPDSLFSADIKNGPIGVIIAGSVNVAPYAVVTTKDIANLQQLKGKIIGGTVITSVVTYLLREYLKQQAGLGYNDYKFLAVGSSPQRLEALQAGQVQAVLLDQPTEFTAISKGFHSVGHVSDVIPAVGDLLYASNKWAKANPDTVVAFLKAWHQSARWLNDPANKDKAVEILAKEINTDPKVAAETYDMYTKLKTFPDDGTIPDRNVQVISDLMSAQGGLPSPAPKVAQFEDFSYNTKANQS